MEKEGSLSNSGRWAQWRYKAIEPIGQSKPDSEIMNELYFRVKSLYQKQGGKFPEPIVNLTWNYGEKDAAGKVRKSISTTWPRRSTATTLRMSTTRPQTPPKLLGKKGDLCASFVHLQADGTTSCGNWIYSQSYTQKEGKIINMMARRGKKDPTGLGMYSEWAWAWPVNRRIIYNRASVDPKGKPWDPKRAVVKWDPVKEDPASKKPGTWVGDVPDGPAPPMATEKGKLPFIMMATAWAASSGRAWPKAPSPSITKRWNARSRKTPCPSSGSIPTVKMFDEKEDAYLLLRHPVPLRGDHLPGVRALADRRHDPPRRLAARDAAPDVRGAEQGTGKGKRHQQRRKGDRQVRRAASSGPSPS